MVAGENHARGYSKCSNNDFDSTSAIYRLEAVGEVDHAEFLNVVVTASEPDGLIPEVAVYDKSGDLMPLQILSNSNGTKVVQVHDVEPNQSYFIVVSPTTGPARFQAGSFKIFAAYSLKALMPSRIGAIALDAVHPIAEQTFTVSTSRLVHLLVASRSTSTKVPHPW